MTNTFLAANSAGGFYSLFSEITGRTDHDIYLIKGGPGTGKSSLMKKVSAAASAKGMEVEQMHCSSDPESLDGVLVKDKKLILLDATAPHCVDPRYAGAVEQILPLGEFWDQEKLKAHRREIIALGESISGIFTSIYRMLSAVGEVQGMSERIISAAFLKDKASAALAKFLRQQAILPLQKQSRIERRFISALSGKGDVLFEDVFADCKQVLVIEESFECSYLLTDLADKMLGEMGYDRLQLLSPLHPERIDHLVLPECSLAIVTQNHRLRFQGELPVIKTLPLKAFLHHDVSAHKNKLAFGKKLCKALYDEVSEHLASEKILHDELEKYYVDAMDFDALNDRTEQFITRIL